MIETCNRVNIGCGMTPTAGWKNFDNSLSLRLAKLPALFWILEKTGLIAAPQKAFVLFARRERIKYADATRRIPLPDRAVDVVYTSHMIEHLDRADVRRFLLEVHRILIPGGILRIVLPDIGCYIQKYLVDRNADLFVDRTCLARQNPRTLLDKIRFLIVGHRAHLWMYDGESLCRLVAANGFIDPQTLQPGLTRIKDPGNLDLWERSAESVCVEALCPS